MKKMLVFVLMVIAFGACSKDDNDSGNSIKKATVKGAQLIYQNSVETRAGTRATTEEVQRFMVVDEKGNVKPIQFITENGDTLDMSIENVKNLNDEYLVLSGHFHFNGIYLDGLLVNKNTELIYTMPSIYNLFEYSIEWNYPTYEDKYGYLYWYGRGHGNSSFYRFDISNPDNLIIENYLQDNIDLRDYWVNGNGLCYYYGDFHNFKCPGGRIYNIKELIPDIDIKTIFCGFNQSFYVVSYNSIYKLDEIGNNELRATKITELEKQLRWYNFCPNPKRNTHITSDGNETIEFNEETGEIKKLEIFIPSIFIHNMGGVSNTFISSESLWVIEQTELYQLNLNNYSLKIINLVNEGYEIVQENITSSPNASGLSFSGLRYSDGQNVVGTINEDGTITAFEKTKTSNKITTLLRLN